MPAEPYDSGDERFHPENIIWSGRQTNIIAIIEKTEGKLFLTIEMSLVSAGIVRALEELKAHKKGLVTKPL